MPSVCRRALSISIMCFWPLTAGVLSRRHGSLGDVKRGIGVKPAGVQGIDNDAAAQGAVGNLTDLKVKSFREETAGDNHHAALSGKGSEEANDRFNSPQRRGGLRSPTSGANGPPRFAPCLRLRRALLLLLRRCRRARITIRDFVGRHGDGDGVLVDRRSDMPRRAG